MAMFEPEGFRWHGPEPPRRCPHIHTYERDERGLLKCSPTCEACAWYKQRYFEQREQLSYPPVAVRPTPAEEGWLLEGHVLWEGDDR